VFKALLPVHLLYFSCVGEKLTKIGTKIADYCCVKIKSYHGICLKFIMYFEDDT
jgi:hypothetical protein